MILDGQSQVGRLEAGCSQVGACLSFEVRAVKPEKSEMIHKGLGSSKFYSQRGNWRAGKTVVLAGSKAGINRAGCKTTVRSKKKILVSATASTLYCCISNWTSEG